MTRNLPEMRWADRYPAERLVPHDPRWPQRYAEVAGALVAQLGPGWEVEHVGSTSVPGLLAKPVIDLALGMPGGTTVDDCAGSFARAGWTEPEPVGDHHSTSLLVDGVRGAIGHVFTARQWPEAHLRLFAHWLRTHPADRDRYAALKSGLVAQGV